MLENWLAGLLSAAAVFLISGREGRAKMWGCILGLAAQPFWFHLGWTNQLGALMALSSWYGFSYARGLWLAFRS